MKFKHLLTVLLVLVICFSLVLVAVACDDSKTDESSDTEEPAKDTETQETTEESLLIANGRFEKFSEGSAPNAPTSWSGTASDSTVDFVAGVVPMKEADYTAAMSAWDNLGNPGNVPDAAEDNHVLLIYNKSANTYTYAPSSSFTTSIGAYYKFTVQFMVKGGDTGITDGSGAYITFYSAAYHQFGPFAASDSWQTVTFYVEASQVSTQTIRISLSMGTAGNPSKGYAFFDNVLAEKITKKDYDEADLSDSLLTASYSMLVPDGDFINVSNANASVQSSYVWEGKKGTDDGANASSDAYITGHSGIISTTVDGWNKWAEAAFQSTEIANVGTPYAKDNTLSSDGKILAISNDYALSASGASLLEDCYTAYGYTNDLKMHIAPNTVYVLSVWVYTDLNTKDEVYDVMSKKEGVTDLDSAIDHSQYGANIIFTGYDNGEGGNSFDNIDTAKEWKEYKFYIVGSPTRYKDVNIELWLGKGGKNNPLRASGTVYFDSVTLSTLTLEGDREAWLNTLNNEYKATAPTQSIVIDIKDNSEELLLNGNFEKDITAEEFGWTLEPINGIRDTENDVLTARIDVEADKDKDKTYWNDTYSIDENPLSPHGYKYVLMINNKNPSAYSLRSNTVAIEANLFYRVSLWVKTQDIAEGKGVKVDLMDADSESAVKSITSVNTATYENEMEGVNGYVQLEFYIKGSNNINENSDVSDTNNVYILVSIGSGNNFSTNDFLSGKVFIANVSMQQIDNEEYKSNTTDKTYSKYKDFSSISSSDSNLVSNGKFDTVTYEEDKYNADGTQKDLYKATSWTIATVDNVTSGVLNVNQNAYVDNTLRPLLPYDFGNSVYNGWADDVNSVVKSNYTDDFGAPNVFVSYTKQTKTTPAKQILSSTTFTLSANKYYIIRGYVRAIGTTGEIELNVGTKDSKVISFGANKTEEEVTADYINSCKWQEICFAVHTGSFGNVSSSSIKLYFGNYSADKGLSADNGDTIPQYAGVIFADSFTCYTVDEEAFAAFNESYAENVKFNDLEYKTETFDTVNDEDSVYSTVVAWSGSGSSHTKEVGIYKRNYTHTELKYLEEVTEKDENGEDVTKEQSNEEKKLTKADVFNTDGLEEGADLSDGVLVINNQQAGYYAFKNSSAITLASKKAYRLTFDARTFNIAEGEFALVRIEIGSDKYDLAFNSQHIYKVDENGNYVKEGDAYVYETKDSKWTRYYFYIENTKSSSTTATVNLMLGMSADQAGTEDSKTIQGTVLFDNITIDEITSEQFTAAYSSVYTVDADGNESKAAGADGYQLINKVVRLKDDYTTTPEENEPDDKEEQEPETDPSLLWLYITSIIIAGILIIVIVVWLIRRFMPKKAFKRKKKIDYDRNNAEDETDKKSKKDSTETKTEDEFKD